MCGRYYRRSDKQKVAEAFHVAQVDDFALPPWDYNVAPTTHQPVIRNNRETGERELVMMRWGLVPHFAKSLADFKGFSTINAGAESLQTTPTDVPTISFGLVSVNPGTAFSMRFCWQVCGTCGAVFGARPSFGLLFR